MAGVVEELPLAQIEQVIGGVQGDVSQQAVQLRMRAGGQNQMQFSRLLAYDAAFATDRQSPFGGIVVVNRPLDRALRITASLAWGARLSRRPKPDNRSGLLPDSGHVGDSLGVARRRCGRRVCVLGRN